jgi:hypothetical protein
MQRAGRRRRACLRVQLRVNLRVVQLLLHAADRIGSVLVVAAAPVGATAGGRRPRQRWRCYGACASLQVACAACAAPAAEPAEAVQNTHHCACSTLKRSSSSRTRRHFSQSTHCTHASCAAIAALTTRRSQISSENRKL